MQTTHRPVTLIILDGWGYSADTSHNAIAAARTPTWNMLWHDYPHTLLSGSGLAVGLPQGQMGNSEVGHLTMGAGRTVYQEFTRIEQAIEEGAFFQNNVLCHAIEQVRAQGKALHILGLLSPGGVHSHEKHILAMLELAAQQQVEQIFIHAFLDGRDTPPQSALASLQLIENACKKLGRGRIASVIGRYYAMDRDKRWDRVQRAYELLTEAKADYHAATASEALQMAYARGETDEFVQATVIQNASQSAVTINDGDAVIFMNFRADRARELTHAFIDKNFNGFSRHKIPKLADFISLTHYAADLATHVAFPPQPLTNVLGEYVAKSGLKQLRIAETEKYAHVTFFFNGGIETQFPGEDRILVPSPKVATYDLQPQMSALEVTDKLVAAIHGQKYALIVCNFANADMVGHSGDFNAAVKAVETIDICLNKIITALQEVGGEAVITADHGNAECMYDEQTQQPHTAHTNEPVPFVYVGRNAKINETLQGTLANIAPTLLYLLGLPKPAEMTEEALLSF